MGTYSLGQGQQMMVYAFQKGVYMRRWSGQYVERPQLLTGDYREDLSDVFWRDTVYYCYRNQRGEYLVKDASQPEKQYVLKSGESMRICSPRLVLFREKLLVFYIEEKEWEGGCSLKGVYLGEGKVIDLPGQYEIRPEFQVLQWGAELLFGVCDGNEWKFYRWCSGDVWEEQAGWAYWRRMKQEEWEKQQIAGKEEWEKLQQDLQYSNQVIESIKAQYEELMDTAAQYREEAKKWRNQYIAACSGEHGKRVNTSLFASDDKE